MKKVLLLMMAILMSIVSFAEEVNLAEVDPAGTTSQHKAPPLLPQVFIDGEELSVLSPYNNFPIL